MLRWVAKHLPEPLRWLGRLFAPASEPGFGFWWMVATLAVAVALGMVVALVLTPVTGIIALLVVAVWALVRRHRHKRDQPENRRESSCGGSGDPGSATIARSLASDPSVVRAPGQSA
jgi:membrane protein implicated in regulation of membrane protease activity